MERQRSIYIKFAILFCSLVVLIIFNRYILHHRIEDTALRLISLVSKDFYRDDRQVSDVASALIMDEALKRENEMLRKQLGVTSGKQAKLLMSNIIFVQRNVLVSMLVLDKGTLDDVKTGSAVIAGGNILAGKVMTVFDHSTWVMLADDPRFSASIRIGNSPQLAGLRGSTASHVSIELVSHTEDIPVGTLITTNGLDLFPDGLLIARVTSSKSGKNLFKDIDAILEFDIAMGSSLFIVQ